jgi:hypothetical protein
VKKDARYNNTNPTQKFKGPGSRGDFRIKSYQGWGAKSKKARGKPNPRTVRGRYLRLIILSIIFSDKFMSIIFSEKSCKAVGMPTWWIGTCFFYIITAGPVLFLWKQKRAKSLIDLSPSLDPLYP